MIAFEPPPAPEAPPHAAIPSIKKPAPRLIPPKKKPVVEKEPPKPPKEKYVYAKQEVLQFEPVTRGRFEKSEPTIVEGQDLSRLEPAERARFRAEKIGFIFQQFHLVPYLTAVENVMLAQYLHSLADEREAADALRCVGLGDRLHHLPSELSGGEQQRVCIARALINQPQLILADEPTGNLDEVNETIVMSLLTRLHREGRTVVIVTHDPAIARMAERRIELHHGRLTEVSILAHREEELFDHLLRAVWKSFSCFLLKTEY